MQFKAISFVTLATVAASLASAAESTSGFGIMNIRSGSRFQFSRWGVKDNRVYVPFDTEDNTAFTIDLDTTLSTGGQFLKLRADDSFELTSNATEATTGFGLGETDGTLTPFEYNGKNSFYACEQDGDYYIFLADVNSNCSGIAVYHS